MVSSKYFCRLCLFPQVFGQVKEWLTLELYEMITVPHIFADMCSYFYFSFDLGRQAGVLKLMKNGKLLVFLAVWFLFPKFLGRLKSNLY